MGINSTEVAYNFGQMGSILVTGTTSCTSNEAAAATDPVGANAVFCAITFVTDTVFNSGVGGLVADGDTESDVTKSRYPSSTGVSIAIDTDAGGVTNSITFPAGLTIYGRWTKFTLASGSVIAYVGY